MKNIVVLACIAWLCGCSTFEPTALNYAELEVPNKREPLEYAVYTPPGWQASERLPLIVFLHGGGGSHQSFERFGGHTELDKRISAKEVNRAIIVFPNGDNGFWENWADGSRHYRDWVLDYMMPKVQHDFKTLKCPEHCHIAGISMGGFGALRITNFEPDRFSSVSAISAPIFTKAEERPSLLLRLLIPFKRIFGDVASSDVLNTNPYYTWVDKRLDKKMRLQLIWGDEDRPGIIEANENFSNKLNDNQIAFQSQVYQGGHKWKYWVPILGDVINFNLADQNGNRHSSSRGASSR